MERKYRQCTAKRTVDNANFKGGVIDFDFSVGSNTVFIPSKSYFRIGVSLTKDIGGALLEAPDAMTFANFCPGNLFDNCFFYAGGSNVSSCINYGPQAHALSYRLSKSGAWLNSIGKDAYGICASFKRRLEMSSAAAVDEGGLVPSRDDAAQHIKYFIYQPPIGIMEHSKPMGSGQYRFQFNPASNYNFAALESSNPAKTEGIFNVKSMELYVCEEKMDISPSGTDTLHLLEHHVQSKKYATNLDFTLPPSTKAISVFVQSGKAGSSFNIPPSRFITDDRATKCEQTLTSLQLTYANCTKPPTNVISDIGLQQRWYDCQIESGQAFSSGGSETLADWKTNGPIYHYSFQRDANDRSTNCQLTTTFSTPPGTDDNVFIVAHYTRSIEISVESGYISNVVSLTI